MDPSTDLWMLPIPNGRMWTTPSSVIKTAPTLPQPGPCIGRAPHPTKDTPDIHPEINIAMFTHSVQMQANAVKFAHQLLCNPKISTLLKATRKGFLKGCPNLTERLIVKYLDPSPGHMKCLHHRIKSTRHKQPGSKVLQVPIILPAPPQPVAQVEAPLLPLFQKVPIYPGLTYGMTPGPQFLVVEMRLGSCSPLPITKPQPYTLFSLSTVESHMEYLSKTHASDLVNNFHHGPGCRLSSAFCSYELAFLFPT
jgi:hypothetical protein